MNVRWLRWILWLAGFGCLWLNLLDAPPLRSGAYVQDVGGGEATVAMITPDPRRLACVVRDEAGAEVCRIEAPDARRRHALRASGLGDGRRYHYALVDAASGEEVDAGSFATPPADDAAPVRFAFVGDSGGLPGWIWLQRAPILHLPARWGWLPDGQAITAIGAAMAEHRPAFVLHLGDVVYPKGQNIHYTNGFFRPFAEVLRHTAYYPVIGNHDAMDDDGRQLLANFHLPRSAQTGDERCFSFAWGAVRVIGLDLNADRLGGLVEAGHPAIEFLQSELRVCSEPWVVVASHFPIRSQSRQRHRGDLQLHLLPVLREHAVSLYLAGHDHCYQRFGPGWQEDAPPLIVSGGGGKSLYDVRPDADVVVESAYHWCSADVAGPRLTVRAHGMDGATLDELVLELPHGAALEAVRRQNPRRAERIEVLAKRR